ncbi:MAG: four helix bundle protein [Clostridia bacterium]|nr:four helix bundle protein [Clostridia bacterium]MBR5428091.1 four helix bundle protein [Clostridia bacterium]
MNSYQDLEVWKKSMELVKEVYSILRLLPKEENYALADQMRRSVISIASNIAEGYGRNSKNDFIRFLNISQGSKCELETQLYACCMLGYIKDEEAQNAFQLCRDIGKMLFGLVNRIKSEQ